MSTLEECLAREAQARARLQEAEEAVERRLVVARAGGDEEVEAFAAWLKEGRRAIAEAEAACAAAEAGTARARAILRLQRAGARRRRRGD